MMVMEGYLERAHAKNTPLDRAWTKVEFLENEARDYSTNKSEAKRDTDEKVFALLARQFGTGSSKIHIQQQFRTRSQTSDGDYMQYLAALEGLRSQGFPNEKVAVRRYEIMQKFNDGVSNFGMKRNLALMYAQEKYVEEQPTVEALRFTVQQYRRMCGSALTDYNQAAPQQPVPPQNQSISVQHQPVPPPVPNAQQVPPQPVAYRQQPPRSCFNCGDPSNFVADCHVNDRTRNCTQQLINSCRTNPHIVNNGTVPAALQVHGTVTFCINCGLTDHAASELRMQQLKNK